MKTLKWMFFSGLISMPAVAGNAYKVVAENKKLDSSHHLVRMETVLQQGEQSQNQFTMTRVVKADDEGNPVDDQKLRASIVLVPGTYQNFDFYDLNEESDRLAGHLAQSGIDVYGFSPRTRGIQAGACDAHPNSCEILRTWNLQTYIDDIQTIRSFASTHHSTKAPFIGGYSMGTAIAFAVLDQHPGDWSGAILTEGAMYFKEPSITAAFEQTCQALRSDKSLSYQKDGQILHRVALLSQRQPFHVSPYVHYLWNRIVFLLGITKASNPPDGEVPHYTLAAGNAVSGLTYSPLKVAEQVAINMNDYDPSALYADWLCSVSGHRDFTGHLDQFRGPVLAFEAGKGYGPYMQDNLNLLGSTDVQIRKESTFGHGDFMGARNSLKVWEEPILNWILQRSDLP